jgi:hypothetical protein
MHAHIRYEEALEAWELSRAKRAQPLAVSITRCVLCLKRCTCLNGGGGGGTTAAASDRSLGDDEGDGGGGGGVSPKTPLASLEQQESRAAAAAAALTATSAPVSWQGGPQFALAPSEGTRRGSI